MSGVKWQGVALAIGMAASLSACGEKKAEGQVLAVVDGNEVTRRDVSAEPAVQNLPAGQDADAMLKNVLQGVIDRELAVEAAKELELDKTPDFIAARDRAEAVLLSQKLFERWTSGMSEPTAAEIKAFQDKNPQIFTGRKILLLERIVAPVKGYDPKELGPLNTMDEIAQFYASKDIKFERGRTQVDSAKIEPKMYAQLNKLEQGYPLAMVAPQGIQILAVVDSKPAPIPEAEIKKIATAGIRQEAIQKKIEALRSKAKITYQKGYDPSTKPAAGNAAPTAPAPSKDMMTTGAANTAGL